MEGSSMGPDGQPDDRAFHDGMLGAVVLDTWGRSSDVDFPALTDRSWMTALSMAIAATPA